MPRVERDGHRDEWTIVELDAVDNGDAGDIRYRLVQHLLRDGSKRGAARFHVACADGGGNVELFMQAVSPATARSGILYPRPGDAACRRRSATLMRPSCGIRPAHAIDALELSRLYRAATPAPVARLEDYRLPDWERQGSHGACRASSLTPILRFADVEAFVQETPGRRRTGHAARSRSCSSASPRRSSRTICGSSRGRTTTRPTLIRFGLASIAEQAGRPSRADGVTTATSTGSSSPVRTYESPLDRRLEEAGFERVATVSLLMKETLVRVAEPAMVPAVR